MPSIITGLGRSGKIRLWALLVCAGLFDRCVRQDAAARAAVIDDHVVDREHGRSGERNDRYSRDGARAERHACSERHDRHVHHKSRNACRPSTRARLNGVAAVQFLGNGQSGKASIKAISGGAASDALELTVGAAAAAIASRVNANPTSGAVRRADTTVITATVARYRQAIRFSGVPGDVHDARRDHSASTVVNTDHERHRT